MVPPPLELLDEQLLPFITFFQNQLTISYPSMTFLNSPEAARYPVLRNVVKLILRAIEDQSSCGPSGATILRMWLGFMHDDVRNGFNPMAMLQDEEVLKTLYTRGMVSFRPPKLALQQSFDNFKICNLEDTFYNITIPGHDKGLIAATSHPIRQASLSCSFRIKSQKSETEHELAVVLGPTDEFEPPIPLAPDLQALKIMIFNAGGVSNPEFIYTFAETCFEQDPHLVIITETRVGGAEGVLARSSMNFPATAAIEPHGYLGGTWLLWKPTRLNVHVLSLDDHQHLLTASVTFPP